MWDDEDGFFYDVLHCRTAATMPLKVRSMVGLIPLFAVETLEPRLIDQLPGFKRRMQWFIENRPDLTHNVASMDRCPAKASAGCSPSSTPDQLRRILKRMLDEEEFLSPYRDPQSSRAPTKITLTSSRATAPGIACELRARRIAPPACSAAIPTGAVRSGFR